MQITTQAWLEYIQKMGRISEEAAKKMQRWIQLNGFGDDKALLDYAYALATHYGEAIGALSCEMYEATAEAQGVYIPSAMAAPTPEYGEVAKAIYGTRKFSDKMVPEAIGRMVKRTGADTTLINAQRDGAQFAWIPHGDTCAFCITLASRGWQHISKKTMKNGHAEHIHPNCNCNYAVRFDGKSNVEGYDPQKYLDMYNGADPDGNPDEKIKALRRQLEEQKRQIYVNDKLPKTIKRQDEIITHKVENSKYETYISGKANHKVQNLKNIEKGIEKSLQFLKKQDSKTLPVFHVLSENEMGKGTIAAYNPVTNEMIISDTVGNKKKTIETQMESGFADPKNPDSTILHELIHWMDAEEYKKTGNISNTEEFRQYLKDLREECKIKLDELEVTEENVGEISRYAEISYIKGKYDEVYTELRVKG